VFRDVDPDRVEKIVGAVGVLIVALVGALAPLMANWHIAR